MVFGIVLSTYLLAPVESAISAKEPALDPRFTGPSLPVPRPKVLVFSRTTGFRHDSIPAAVAALKSFQEIAVDATEDPSVFNPENLKQYDCIVFANTTGTILNDSQKRAMEDFVNQGKGWVGIHSASDTEYSWPWYAELVGAYFKSHPPGGQKVRVVTENPGNVSSSYAPRFWIRADEWYDFNKNPRDRVTVLASADESYYRTPALDHPLTWYHDQGKGRAWYTAMGHFRENYSESYFLDHLKGGILWASQNPHHESFKPVQFKSTPGWSNVSSLVEFSNSVGEINGKPGLISEESMGDCRLHLEFKIPKGSNSGVYLQGRYEIQIFDSFGKPNNQLTFSDCGSVYQRFDEAKQRGWEGRPADRNAFAGPYQWNRLDLIFRAPRFKGKKISNARFEDVRLNGVLLHSRVEVTGPTRAAMFSDEKPLGPLMLQGDHGPVSFRNIRLMPLPLGDVAKGGTI